MRRRFSGLFVAVFLLTLSSTIIFAKEHSVKASFMKTPLSFIKNDGQKDPSILYFEQGTGHITSFTKDGISFTLSKMAKVKDAKQTPEVVTLTPLNASPFTIEAIDKREGKINYLIGNDSKKWKTNIPTYGAILYKNIYPGIDVKFYGTNSQLEYDIIVSPQADPSKVRFSYKGIEKLSLTPTGDLDISLKEGSLLQKKPIIYQSINGIRKEIEGKFILAGTAYGFEVGLYDKNHPLVIDPVLIYSTYLGGYYSDDALGIAVDSSGSAYVAGQTDSNGFPTQDPYQGAYGGGDYDAFVTKFDSSGNLVYSTYLGGGLEDCVNAIAVDSSGNAYVTGYTFSTNFPTQNAFQGSNAGSSDAFVTKLNPEGNGIVYSTYLGDQSLDIAYGVAVDSSDNAYVAGYTSSTDFPTQNPYQGSYGGGTYDAFVAKLSSSGSELIYSTYLGGYDLDCANAIAVDSSGSAYVAGQTCSTNFPTQNAYQGSNKGGCDAFVTKFNSSGSALVYSTYLGGNHDDLAWSIAFDTSGNAYVVGITASTNFPTQNAYQGSNKGGSDAYHVGDYDAFVTKFNSSGSALVYSTYLGGSGYDEAFGIKVDSSGSAYVAGYTASTNFPTQNAYQESFGGGNYDAFVTKLHPAGNQLVYSTYIGGYDLDCANTIAVDSSGNAYLAGVTASDNFPTYNAYQGSHASGYPYDAFVTKISPMSFLSIQKDGLGTVTSDTPGINCGGDCSEIYQEGTVVTLTASADPGFVFRGWSGGGCSGTALCVVTINANTTVTATFTLRPVLSPEEGTITTQITVAGSDFGIKKGKLLIGNTATKIITWTPSSITCEVTKPLLPDLYSVTLTLKEPKGVAPITISGAFTMMAPDIGTVSPDTGAEGTPITISGSYFGSKKGKVYLGEKKCKVSSWSMNTITFFVPKKMPSDSYNITVTNKIGSDILTNGFTIP